MYQTYTCPDVRSSLLFRWLFGGRLLQSRLDADLSDGGPTDVMARQYSAMPLGWLQTDHVCPLGYLLGINAGLKLAVAM